VRPCLLSTVALLALASIFGCGDADDNAETAVRANAVKQAALAHRLDRLRGKLHHRRTLLRAQHEQATREIATEQPVANSANADDAGSFNRLAGELSGEVGAVIGPPGSSEVADFGSLQSGSAWSTSKVPIALRVLQEAGGPSGLSAAQADEMRSALTLSDNEAAAALFADLEQAHSGVVGASAAVGEVLREAGDNTTQISTQGRDGFSSYGQTDWSLSNQQQFMSRLAAGCIGSPRSREYVLSLMGEVSSDTWGLGSSGLPARWKGGWGPGVDGRYLVRQMGILYLGDREAVVTLAAIPADGQLATGEAMATSIALWLARQARKVATVPSGC
jgi:hypothetical protein